MFQLSRQNPGEDNLGIDEKEICGGGKRKPNAHHQAGGVNFAPALPSGQITLYPSASGN